MAARGCQDLFNFTEMDAGSPELYAATAAKVCGRSAKELLKEVCSSSGSPSLKNDDDDGAVDSILDIGCGTGETTQLLLDAWPRTREVLGVDRSELFLEYARAECADERVSFALLDADEDVWPTNWSSRFTKVFSNYALHWIKDHRKLMANVARVLAPGGELIAQFFHSTCRNESELAAAKMAAEELGCSALLQQFLGNRRVEQDWKNPDNYCNLVTSLGLSVRRCAVVERTVQLESRVERAGMALTVNPLVSLLPEHLRARFAVRYTENLRDPYVITHNVVTLHAVKPAANSA